MSKIRALSGGIEFHNPLKHSSQMQYVTDHPRDAVLEEDYFLPLKQYFTPGDECKIIAIRDDGTWDKCIVECVVASPQKIVVQQTTEWRHGGVVAMANLKAVHVSQGKWNVVEEATGKIMASGLTKKQAEGMAHNVPVVSPSAAERADTAEAA